mmetsp:Transcript_22038/g.33656  ORF Transcript_22038/g.33656 Transcript_22038/m.33656 type:complete len:477 (+) Transcript_22038:143-1573(+)|eukprot:CAMPEP_0196818120 /NCGR_PEP_ID=MMETSP1362-20130617/64060_1 /TAXON_ID=163516 /ORGANISM="Leptocylindrus danicus, Strain CCMP1856" /LENGTH=476 /DNA_ID=CAMNT_0042196071 /DNA_START=109 /DNA_END=1539 /DNA_ORIENTATION=-
MSGENFDGSDNDDDDSGSEDTRNGGGSFLGFTLNGYKGVTLPTTDIPTITFDDTSPEVFFRDFVSKRKPCIISGHPALNDGTSWRDQFTYNKLVACAGTEIVQVEKRLALSETFGQNRTAERQIEMSVQEFLDCVCDGKAGKRKRESTNKCTTDGLNGENLYLSTQSHEDDDEFSHPFSAPCRQMMEKGWIPMKPDLAGGLILQSCNLWMGRSRDGSSSGLHHDYHDNLYVLVRGKKRFRLFSPDQAENLATNGIIDRVYFNGRISYVDAETRADGRPIDFSGDEDGDEDEFSATNEESTNQDVIIGKGFDYVSSGEEEDEDIDWEANGEDNFDEEMNVAENDLEQDDTKNISNVADAGDNDKPVDSFSRIDFTSKDRCAILNEFPNFEKCTECILEVEAGQMLYLPCGWFHEVTSFSEKTNSSSTEDDAMKNCHIAVNYWFHPPDNLNNETRPYSSNFWGKYLDEVMDKSKRKKE